MPNSRSIFDIVGPAMIGPSSSHTAGAVRLGALARAIYGKNPKYTIIKLHGSFQATGDGHGTKLALIAGLLGMAPDDERIPHSFEVANERGLDFMFQDIDLEEAHPNTAQFLLSSQPINSDAERAPLAVIGSSIGGGNVVVTHIGSFKVHATGELPLLVVEHTDQPGVISRVGEVLADSRYNIASMHVSRKKRGAEALMLIELDQEPDSTTLSRIMRQTQVHQVHLVPAV